MTVWRHIHDSVREEIRSGAYATGDRLPTEKVLSERFGVNRHTVRRALAELTREGVITVRRGSGAYVSEGVIDYQLGARVKFGDNVRGLGRDPRHRLLSADTGVPSDAAIRHLKLREGQHAVTLKILSEVDGLPVLFGSHVFDADRFAGIADAFERTRSISGALRDFGVIDYRRDWTRISAIAASRATAETLRQSDAQPVLMTESLNLDMSGQPVEYAHCAWASARTQFVI